MPQHERYGRIPYRYTERLIQHLNEELDFRPDFVVHTGDVTDFPTAECASLAASLLAQLHYPIYYVVGNHDGRAAMRQHLMGQAASDERLYYEFYHGDTHFVALDTIGEVDPGGLVSQDQLAWLEAQLATSQARQTCLLIHHLPVPMGVPWYDREMRITNAEALFAVLAPHRERLRGVFFGHIHRPLTAFRDGILMSAVGSAFMQFRTSPADHAPVLDPASLPCYSIVTLSDGLTTVTHHTVSM